MTIEYQSAAADLLTLRDWLRWTTSRFNESKLFFGHGNSDAFNEASQLILHSLGLPLDSLPELFMDARLTIAEKQKLIELIQQRIEARIPVAYLTKEAWFVGLPFHVDERVLIPRSPFAELIAEQFTPWLAAPETVSSILDMCTGSACIAIACAYAFPEAQVDAIDIDHDALQVAALNQQRHHLEDRLKLIHSDLWCNLDPSRRYDLIVSNPPYVGAEEMAGLPAEYRHEPASALQADNNGLALVEQIIRGAAEYLQPHGLLFVEVGNSDQAVALQWPDIDFMWLELANGGHGIFMLDQQQCCQFAERYPQTLS